MLLERLDRFESATLINASQQSLRRFGVPPGGPVDRATFAALGGCREVWECFGIAISEWRVNEPGWICLQGAPRQILLNGESVQVPVKVREGDLIRILPVIAGQVSYLALSDNLIAPITYMEKREVRVLPSADDLDQQTLFAQEFSVSLSSSRHGWRLNETVSGAKDLPRSEPCAPGVIQCTPSGQLIIIGPDGPTIGGYARIGAVIEEDLDLLARIGFNKSFGFTKCEF